MSRRVMPIIILIVLLGCASVGAATLESDHGRPYFMPERERVRIQHLITTEDWARNALESARARAKHDGYSAALLYALEGDNINLATAKNWLMRYGTKGGDLGERALKADEEFLKQGQPWLGDVYYQTDDRPLVAFDWIYPALTAEERKHNHVRDFGIRQLPHEGDGSMVSNSQLSI